MVRVKNATDEALVCGIVRPISEFDRYSAAHWSEVGEILDDSAQLAGFESRLVSEASSTGIIHARIVTNLYRNPIVVCDISGKNPNVMLELGMRLAFDKPVVVVKDDLTDYSFDTSPIEHLSYPFSLHYPSVVDFKKKLSEKIRSTCESFDASKSFLQQFGPIKVADIKEVSVPGYKIVMEEVRELRNIIQSTVLGSRNSPNLGGHGYSTEPSPTLTYRKKLPDELKEEVCDKAAKLNGVDRISINTTDRFMTVRVKADKIGGWSQREANDAVRELIRPYLSNIILPDDVENATV